MYFNCPLCTTKGTLFSKDRKREYYRCPNCKLIYVPKKHHISLEDEKKRYKLHENCKSDPKYIEFLNRIVPVIVERVKEGERGLDFGCGPSPVLPTSLEKYGIETEIYDPIFYNKEHRESSWDFIVSTEVFEHLVEPDKVINQLWNAIKDSGYIFIMTRLYSDDLEFKSWYYKGDPTHIIFFTRETFLYIKEKLKCELEFHDKDIVILRKV